MTDMNETNLSTRYVALPGQERYVAPLEETPLKEVDSVDEEAPASSLWADAWRTLRKNPLFIIAGVLIVFIVFVRFSQVCSPSRTRTTAPLTILSNRPHPVIRSDTICRAATCMPAWCTEPAPR